MKTLKAILVVCGILTLLPAFPQQTNLSLPHLFCIANTQITIPVVMTNHDSIGNISLAFTYDTTVLTFVNNQLHVPINPFLAYTGHKKNQIRFSWCDLGECITNAYNDTLLLLNFTYHGGYTSLAWDLSQRGCLIGRTTPSVQPSTFTDGSIGQLTGGNITGSLVYDNAAQSPLSQAYVILFDENESPVANTVTDQNGNFTFTVYNAGNYRLSISPLPSWNGVNSVDALKIVRHFAGQSALSGIALKAADVNMSGTVNSSDALWVLKRFTGLANSFPAGDWTFDNTEIILNTVTDININIKALFMGDVDKSFQGQ